MRRLSAVSIVTSFRSYICVLASALAALAFLATNEMTRWVIAAMEER